jgi:Family of unknown function (DUF6165)
MKLLAEISPGELIDKITILEIKCANIADLNKLAAARYELRLLRELRTAHITETVGLLALEAGLKSVNAELWRIEDEIRELERVKQFGDAFVALARSVYRTNDKRAALKQDINKLLNSKIQEVKSYQSY